MTEKQKLSKKNQTVSFDEDTYKSIKAIVWGKKDLDFSYVVNTIIGFLLNSDPITRLEVVNFLHDRGFKLGEEAEHIRKDSPYWSRSYELAAQNFELIFNILMLDDKYKETLKSVREPNNHVLVFNELNRTRKKGKYGCFDCHGRPVIANSI